MTTINISPPPLREPVTGGMWTSWFSGLHKALKAIFPKVSADRGDASVTLQATVDASTQRFATTLTGNRAVTLSTVNGFVGAKFRVIRESTATGAFNLDIGPGIKTLSTAGTWCDVEFDGTAWRQTGGGSL